MTGALLFSGISFHSAERLMSMKQKSHFACAIFCLVAVPGWQRHRRRPAPAHPPVEVIQATAPDASVLKARKSSYSFNIESGDWTDTGVEVTPADQLNFTATGNLTLADGRQPPPDGLTRGWKDLIRVLPAQLSQ